MKINSRYALNKSPMYELMEHFNWGIMDISGANDLEKFEFFKKYPNSKQRNLWKELKDLVNKIDDEVKDKFILDVLVWFSDFCISLSHTYGDIEDSKNEVNKQLKNFINSLFNGD